MQKKKKKNLRGHKAFNPSDRLIDFEAFNWNSSAHKFAWGYRPVLTLCTVEVADGILFYFL